MKKTTTILLYIGYHRMYATFKAYFLTIKAISDHQRSYLLCQTFKTSYLLRIPPITAICGYCRSCLLHRMFKAYFLQRPLLITAIHGYPQWDKSQFFLPKLFLSSYKVALYAYVISLHLQAIPFSFK